MTVVNLQPGASGIDTYIFSISGNNNYGVAVTFQGNGTTTEKSMIRFDLSSIPAGAIINSATLRLRCTQVGVSDSADISLYRALTEWYEGDASGGTTTIDGSTWNNRNHIGTVAWSGGAGGASGSDYNATPSATTAVTVVDADYDWDVAADVQNFIDGVNPNYGWWILHSGGSTTSKQFSTSDNATAGNRPELIIDYTEGPLPSVVDSISITDSATVALEEPGVSYTIAVADSVSLAESVAGFIENFTLFVSDSVSLAEDTTLFFENLFVDVSDSISVAEDYSLKPSGYIAPSLAYNALPILYITDGVIEGGRERRLNLLSSRSGFHLCEWEPAVAQYKGGGMYNDSPLATGRRLVFHRYQNATETMTLEVLGESQNRTSSWMQQLFRWMERASAYWEGNDVENSVYLVARSAYETNTRYALIHKGFTETLRNPYAQPFFSGINQGRAIQRDFTLFLERGHWQDNPPGSFTCVPVGGTFTWQFSQVETGDTTPTGTVLSLIQASNGDILAGTNDTAKIYYSTDDGDTWSLLTTLGAAGSDAVNNFVRHTDGTLYAALSGGATARGVWKSTNNGTSWVKVKTPPGTNPPGYFDVAITVKAGQYYLYAVGQTDTVDLGVISKDNSLDDSWETDLIAGQGYKYVAVAGDVNYVYAWAEGINLARAIQEDSGGFENNSYRWPNVPSSGKGKDMVRTIYPTTNFTSTARFIGIALNGSDTEVFYVEPSSGFFGFQEIAQVPSINFLSLYADPANATPGTLNQTLWAGADGSIWRSNDCGYTWTQVSTNVTGEVHAFLRTVSGKLIIGDEGQLNILQDDPVAGAAQSITLGQSPTCDGVFVTSKSSLVNLTNIKLYNDDDTSYTDIYPVSLFPQQLLPTVPEADDAVYFGVDTSLTETPIGPFTSLIFNLSSESDEIGTDLTIAWEYWDGSAWSAMSATYLQDGTENFSNTGVREVNWFLDDWATTSVDSVTGYWVRARVSSVGSNPSPPYQITRDIYPVGQPQAKIALAEVKGDLPAKAQLQVFNINGTSAFAIGKVIVGLRSLSRGNRFNSYINISDRQVPSGLVVAATSGSFAVAVNSATGRILSYTLADVDTWYTLSTLTFSTVLADHYYGRYRAFIRTKQVGGSAGDIKYRLRTTFGSSGVPVTLTERATTKAYTNLTDDADWELIDMGLLNFPSISVGGSNDIVDTHIIEAQVYSLSGTPVVHLTDLILMPADEWYGEFRSIASGYYGYADIDSVTNPKKNIRALGRTPGGLIRNSGEAITSQPVFLQLEQDQNFWFLFQDTTTAQPLSLPSMTALVKVNKLQQYLGLRGNN